MYLYMTNISTSKFKEQKLNFSIFLVYLEGKNSYSREFLQAKIEQGNKHEKYKKTIKSKKRKKKKQ